MKFAADAKAAQRLRPRRADFLCGFLRRSASIDLGRPQGDTCPPKVLGGTSRTGNSETRLVTMTWRHWDSSNISAQNIPRGCVRLLVDRPQPGDGFTNGFTCTQVGHPTLGETGLFSWRSTAFFLDQCGSATGCNFPKQKKNKKRETRLKEKFTFHFEILALSPHVHG